MDGIFDAQDHSALQKDDAGLLSEIQAILTARVVGEQKLAAQNQKLLAEIRDLQSSKALPIAAQRGQPWRPSGCFDNRRTALSFFWFGDMESHFRNPVNFFVVPDADHRLHKVELTDFVSDDQENMFVSTGR